LWRWVRSHVEPGAPTPPRETLLARSGSPTALLAAMARAVDLSAELVMIRLGTAARVRSPHPNPQHFEELWGRVLLPSDVFWFRLDGATAFGGKLPAEARGGSFVRVEQPVDHPARPIRDAWIDATPQLAELDATLSPDGTLTGTLTWSLRKRYVEPLAELEDRAEPAAWPGHLEHALAPVWPGIEIRRVAIDATGPRGRMTAAFRWPWFAPDHGRIEDFFSEMPLAPTLAEPIPADYVTVDARTTPLLVTESRELFRVRLRIPSNLVPAEVPRGFRRVTPFGSFEQQAIWDDDASTLEFMRARWLPQVRVQPEDYGAFRQTLSTVRSLTRNRLVLADRAEPAAPALEAPNSSPPNP